MNFIFGLNENHQQVIKKGINMKYWAYLHSGSGKLILKRYFVHGDIVSADRSPYIRKRTEPFTAEDRERALVIATAMLNETQS